jgi:hypothetical protein
MNRDRSFRPSGESLEKLALLSTGVVSADVHGAAEVRATTDTGPYLSGAIVSGRGYVRPLGSVRGQYSLIDDTLTLYNKNGSLQLQLSNLHQTSHLVRFSSWEIVQASGTYSSMAGSGSGSFNVVIHHDRAVFSDAIFY